MIVLCLFKSQTSCIKPELAAGLADLFLDAKTLQCSRALVAGERRHIENFGSVTNSHGINPVF